MPSAEPSAFLEDATSASLVPAEARLRLLAEATAHLADTLDVRAVAQGVARTVVPTLAETVHVDLVESLFHPEGGTVPDSTVLLRVAAVDGSGPETGLEEWVAYPPGSPAAAALAGVTSGEVFVDDEGTEWLYVPLRARGRVLGVVGLNRRGPGTPVPSGRHRAGRGDRDPRSSRAGQRPPLRRGPRDRRRAAALVAPAAAAAGHRGRQRSAVPARGGGTSVSGATGST